MTDNHTLHVEVQGANIIVMLPGTNYVATYQKSPDGSRLIKKGRPHGCIEFKKKAWRSATDKAQELGWIVKMPEDEVRSWIKAELQRKYGERLLGAILCGSHARGEQHHSSDWDVRVALQNGPPFTAPYIRERLWIPDGNYAEVTETDGAGLYVPYPEDVEFLYQDL